MSLLLAAAIAGTLCLDGDCRALERIPARVASADAARSFVWIEPKRVVVGTIAAHERRLPAGEAHAIDLRVSDGRAVPVTMELSAANKTWTWSMPAPAAFTLVYPPGEGTLRASAEEYRGVTATLGESTTLLLRRLPVIRGVVVDVDGSTPLAGAEVSVPGTRPRAATGENGAFRLVIDGEWPQAIEVAHPTRAAKLVAIPPAVADTELPAIRMSAGGTLRLHVAPPIGGREALVWEVRADGKVVRTGSFEAGSASVDVEGLAPGDYRVLLRGSQPLQRFVTNARIADAQVTEAFVEIRPLLVEGEVTFGGTPLGSVSIELRPRSGAWIDKLKTGEDGRFAEELWQAGEYSIGVFHHPVVPAWSTRRELTGDTRVKLELAIPNRIVRGRVVDAQNGAPVGDAWVSLRVTLDPVALGLTTRSAADGSYEFSGVEAGPATLEVLKPGYRFARPATFVLGEDRSIHEEILVVEALPVARTVVVTDTHGVPLAGAAVFVPNRAWDDLLFAAETDASGRATIHLRSTRERGTLFVVPRSGSLGFAPLAGEGELVVRVDDRASMTFAIESTSGEPLPRVMVMMSIDGVPVPPRVLDEMARIQGVPLYTNAQGRLVHPRMPSGRYDFEPIAGRGEVGKAVNVMILPGEQMVRMKLEPYFR